MGKRAKGYIAMNIAEKTGANRKNPAFKRCEQIILKGISKPRIQEVQGTAPYPNKRKRGGSMNGVIDWIMPRTLFLVL
jgi:hypothetical protein